MEGLLLLAFPFLNYFFIRLCSWVSLSLLSGVINADFIVYFSIGSDPGILKVLLDSGSTEQELLFETQLTGNDWKNVSITVNESRPFQV